MVFTEEDKVAVKFLSENKHYGAKRFLKEFLAKQWSLGGLNRILKKNRRERFYRMNEKCPLAMFGVLR